MLHIDGRHGEGGGQVLRSSLALAAATGQPFHITDIRGRRKRPGLLRQHLTAARAAAQICGGGISNVALGASELTFSPGAVRAGDYHFAVGTAGSCMLVLQTVLPPLLLADGPSAIVLEGGTHNPSAPTFDALCQSFLPQLEAMGATVTAELVRPGFYPAGGGLVRVQVQPAARPRPFELLQRGRERTHHATIAVAHLPEHVADNERKALQRKFAWARDRVRVTEYPESRGPGNVVAVHLVFDNVTETATAFGMRNVPARRVAERAAAAATRYLASAAPVGEHLADQLLLPMALLAGGRFHTLPATLHTTTNAEVIGWFLGEGRVTLGESGEECVNEVAGMSRS